MLFRTHRLLAPTLAVLGAAGLGAQDSSPELRATQYASLSTGVALNGTDDKTVGVVEDHVLDAESGQVLFLVMRARDARGRALGEQRLVPYDRVAWDAKERELSLTMLRRDLDKLKVFEPKRFELPDTVADPTAEYLTSSAASAAQVHAAGAPFAPVRELIVEPARGVVAFVLVAPRGKDATGDPHVIPWAAAAWRATPRRDDGHFAVRQDVRGLMKAPRLKDGDVEQLEDAKTRARIYAFYGLEVPTPPPTPID